MNLRNAGKKQITQAKTGGNFYRLPLIYFVTAVGVNLVVELLARRSFSGFFRFLTERPLVFFYGVLLIWLTLSVSLLFRRRAFYYSFICAAWVGLALTDCILLSYRAMPLTARDILLMPSVRDIFEKYMSHVALAGLMLGISVVLGALFLLWYCSKRFPSVFLIGITNVALLGLALFAATRLMIGSGCLSDPTHFGSLPDAYDTNGFAYCFAASAVTGGVSEPSAYSQESVDAILEHQDNLPETNTQTPNLIFVQLESFFDANYLRDLTYAENPVPNFEALKRQCSHGSLFVPAIGAGTANTEFEVLTGMNLNFFGVGEYPFTTTVYDSAIEALPDVLSRMGYSTHAIHNNNATFYDRDLVYANLGMQSFTSLEYMNHVRFNPIGWAEDAVLTGEIMKTLRSTQGRDFVFTISVQAHGKYPTAPIEGAPTVAVAGAQSEARKNALEYYLYQLRQTDAFVGSLIRMLHDFDEPTVVVFYGDHLPSLNITQEELLQGDTQTTEYVIWTNFEQERQVRDLQTYQLAAYVMELFGIREGTIFRHHQVYDYAPEENQSYQDELASLQYDMTDGEHFYLHGGSPPEATQLRFGVQTITVDGVMDDPASGGETLIVGTNFTPYSVIYRNGKPEKTQYLSSTTLRLTDALVRNGDALTVAQVSATDETRVLSQTTPFFYEIEETTDERTATTP